MTSRSWIVVAVVAGLVLAAVGWRRCSRPAEDEPAPAAVEPKRPGSATLATAPRTIDHVVTLDTSYDDDPPGELRLEGQVIDEQEAPVGGAAVILDSHPPREAVTEEDGSFVFEGLVPRLYQLEAHAGGNLAGPVGVRLTASSPPIVLRLRQAARVAVDVRTPDDQPVVGALVEVRALAVQSALTESSGRATIRGVGGGWHVLKVSAAGYASVIQELAVVDAPGHETTVTVRLRPGVALAGTVVGPDGSPIEGASVVAESVSRYDSFVDARLDGVVTDAKGRWRLTGLPRETMRLRARHAGFAPTVTTPIPLADGVERAGIVIAMDPGARVAGRVVDPKQAPIAGAEVRVMGEGVTSSVVRRVACDRDGRFTISGLPRRRIYLAAYAEAATSGPTPVELAGGDRDGVVLELDRALAIGGVIVTKGGEPVPEARVVVEPTLGTSSLERVDAKLHGELGAIADMDGRFTIPGLAPGSYHVRAIRPGAPRAQLAMKVGVTVEAGRTDARIEVDELGTLKGKVEVAGGQAVGAYWVQLGTEAPRWFDTPEFQIEGVPAGRYFVQIDGPDIFGTGLPDIELAAGGVRDLGAVPVSRGRVVRGTVVDASGAKVAGATVVVGRQLTGDGLALAPYPDASLEIVASDRDGRFAVRGIGTMATVIAAEHEVLGRALGVAIAAGPADVELTLALRPPGVVQGFVRIGKEPAEANVMLHSSDAPNLRFEAPTGPDGAFRFDRVAPGRYTLYGALRRGTRASGSDGTGKAITVEAGRVLDVDLELAREGVTVALVLGPRGGGGAEFGYGLMAATEGPVSPIPRTVTEARQLLATFAGIEVREGMIVKDRQIELSPVRPGHQLACAAPLRGNPRDPSVVAEMQQNVADWPITCRNVQVAPGLPRQEVVVDVAPLPPK